MTKTRLTLGIALLLAPLGAAHASADPQMDAAVKRINDQWAHIRYEVRDRAQQERQLSALAGQAAQVVARYPNRAEPLLWQGIVVSEEAARANMFSQLGYAKQAKAILDRAAAIDMRAENGGVAMSLGVLYAKVPGFPIAFGSPEKAKKLLETALAMDPGGLDASYFYADFINNQGQHRQAKAILERALRTPVNAERPVWDAGRRAEIRTLLTQINRQL
jgi:tetratricopeptide (TPR) repeat protein